MISAACSNGPIFSFAMSCFPASVQMKSKFAGGIETVLPAEGSGGGAFPCDDAARVLPLHPVQDAFVGCLDAPGHLLSRTFAGRDEDAFLAARHLRVDAVPAAHHGRKLRAERKIVGRRAEDNDIRRDEFRRQDVDEIVLEYAFALTASATVASDAWPHLRSRAVEPEHLMAGGLCAVGECLGERVRRSLEMGASRQNRDLHSFISLRFPFPG